MRATSGRPSLFRLHVAAALLALLVLLPGCASAGKQGTALERAQYAWTGAVRWNDMKTAWQLVDPEYRTAHPASELDFARYEGMQGNRFIERAVTDEIMYELMQLTGQKYVDIYAASLKDKNKPAAQPPSASAA